MSSTTWTERFSTYFSRDVAQRAAKSISDGAEMEFRIGEAETFTFFKTAGKNAVKNGAASEPHLVFIVSEAGAEKILSDNTEELGKIGVNIAKLVVAKEVKVQFKAGFLKLFAKGYLGVVTAGGGEFASYLASRGLNGMGAIKAALKNMKG